MERDLIAASPHEQAALVNCLSLLDHLIAIELLLDLSSCLAHASNVPSDMLPAVGLMGVDCFSECEYAR